MNTYTYKTMKSKLIKWVSNIKCNPELSEMSNAEEEYKMACCNFYI